MSTKRFEVVTTERHGTFYFSLVGTASGAVALEEGEDLAYYFDGASMLESGLPLEQVRELLSVRPIGKKCGC